MIAYDFLLNAKIWGSTLHTCYTYFFLTRPKKIKKHWGRNKVEFPSISQEFRRYGCPAGESNTLQLILLWLQPFEIEGAISVSQIRRPRIKQNLATPWRSNRMGTHAFWPWGPPSPIRLNIFLVAKLSHNDFFYVITAFMCHMGFSLFKGFHK